jgi:hypothetical protein
MTNPARSDLRTLVKRHGKTSAPRYQWVQYTDRELLAMRFCDLKLRWQGSAMAPLIERLYDELACKGLSLKPHVWLSVEWFSPDGIPGIAVPFYLAHPRLARLERKQMFQVEGGSDSSAMRILRHEAGHAIDTAYRLRRKKRWRETFGPASTPYPDSYKPKPDSRHYVTHLDWWYAQAHPTEDFAETFAVWLKPGNKWHQQYKGWPALKKLEVVDQLMSEVAETPPPVRNRRTVEPTWSLRKTLGQHYQEKKQRYGHGWPAFLDGELRKLFSDDPVYRRRLTAASFLRRIRPELRDTVARWTGTHRYTIDQVLKDMIDRCQELNLRLTCSESRAKREATVMVSVQTMRSKLGGHHSLLL